MTSQQFQALAGQIEIEAPLSEETAAAVMAALARFRADWMSAESGQPDDLRSADFVLHLVDRALPGWSIHLAGTAYEPNGHWTCQLRPSQTRDDYEFIGHGKGASLANVLIAALLRSLAYLHDGHAR